jgi:hypothetical protein
MYTPLVSVRTYEGIVSLGVYYHIPLLHPVHGSFQSNCPSFDPSEWMAHRDHYVSQELGFKSLTVSGLGQLILTVKEMSFGCMGWQGVAKVPSRRPSLKIFVISVASERIYSLTDPL